MTLIESELGKALNPPVRRKANRTGNLRATARRVSGGSTEVMVKITGFSKGLGHVKANLDYISRNGKLEMENERGELFRGKDEVKTIFQDWENEFDDGKRHKNRRDTMHLMLSMPETTDPESVKNASREFARSTFGGNHEYLFVLHTDEPHPHCHVTVKCLGFDGARLNPRKADLQQWREQFAEKLRDQGVDAEATPRRSRGVVRKAEPAVIRHIEHGDQTHEPRVSKVRAAKIRLAVQELIAGVHGDPAPAKPWEDAIKARQEEIRAAWLIAADTLEQENTRITFNQKEARNEHPDYERIDARRARAGQRAAAVYQSGAGCPRRQEPPGTVAGLRNLSSLGLVHHERASQMLLQPDASDRMGRDRIADSQMRRARTGDNHAPGDAQRVSHHFPAAENVALAERIRCFVTAMPDVKTERYQIIRDLAQKFSRPVDRIRSNSVAEALPQPDLVKQTRATAIPATKQKGRDIER